MLKRAHDLSFVFFGMINRGRGVTNLHFANQQRNGELRTIGIFMHKTSYNQEFENMLDHYSWTEVAYIYFLVRLHTLAQMPFFLKKNFSKPKNIHTQKKHLLTPSYSCYLRPFTTSHFLNQN